MILSAKHNIWKRIRTTVATIELITSINSFHLVVFMILYGFPSYWLPETASVRIIHYSFFDMIYSRCRKFYFRGSTWLCLPTVNCRKALELSTHFTQQPFHVWLYSESWTTTLKTALQSLQLHALQTSSTAASFHKSQRRQVTLSKII